MLRKKSTHAELNNYRKLLFQLGLLLALFLVYTGLEWKTFEREIEALNGAVFETEELVDIPMTQRKLEIKPPPPPPPAPEQIVVVENDTEIEETVLESTETDQTEAVEYTEIEEISEVVEEEEVEEVPFAVIEEAPIFPGCTGSKAEKKKCLQEQITLHINKHYNTGLTEDLGLAPGRKKVFVMFMIDQNGNVTGVRARGPHKRLEKEAEKVINLLPPMEPGRQRGKPVIVRYSLPITLLVK